MEFDARPLTDPVDRATVAAYRKQLAASGRAPGGSGVIAIVIGVVVAAIFATFAITLVGGLVTAMVADGSRTLGAVGSFVILGVIGVAAAALIVRGVRGSAERAYRLDHFARANGMTWYPEASAPPLPGMIFSHGHSRKARDILRGEKPRLVEFANYRYTTGSGKNQTTHRWGYVAIRLGTPLPHIVLDAEGNNALFGSNLPQAFDRSQRLRLEGDFDKHFALYCPEGYEQDALYLFTPDIMARFIDNAAQLDVEIVDDWLFLYAKRDFSTLDPRTWAWLFSVVGALFDKLGQWERWRDDRLALTDAAAPASVPTGGVAAPLPFTAPVEALRPPPGVAPRGRRLKAGIPWASIVIVLIVALVFAAQSGFFGVLFNR
ncbi:hypothetical protein [Microbacterium oleivorans]|uniref:hypothetical protein n=2 Tax=Microbacterium oleivorans TaxID=273677 RepID=UPI000766F834|nr:hypothetical protein [Microbacterium oleivorans]